MVLDRGIVPSSSVPIMTLTCTALYPRSLLFLVVSLVISFVTVPPLIYPLQAIPVSPRTNSRCLSSLPLHRPSFGSLPGTVLQTSIYPTFFFLFLFLAFYSFFTVTSYVCIYYIHQPRLLPPPYTFHTCILGLAAHLLIAPFIYTVLFIYDHDDTCIMSLMILMTTVQSPESTIIGLYSDIAG